MGGAFVAVPPVDLDVSLDVSSDLRPCFPFTIESSAERTRLLSFVLAPFELPEVLSSRGLRSPLFLVPGEVFRLCVLTCAPMSSPRTVLLVNQMLSV